MANPCSRHWKGRRRGRAVCTVLRPSPACSDPACPAVRAGGAAARPRPPVKRRRRGCATAGQRGAVAGWPLLSGPGI